MSSNKNDDDLVGFREFIEKDKRSVSPREKRQINHEMLTFLEHESSRLQNLVSLYEEKSFLLKEHDQYQILRQKASARLHQLRQNAVTLLKDDGEHFKKNLKQVLGSHFKN